MASFASDRKVEITTETTPQEIVGKVAISDGVLRATTVSRITTTYRIKGASDAKRTVLIEHPRRDGWQMEAAALDSATPTHYRLRAAVEAGGSSTVRTVMERSRMESFALSDASADALYVWAGSATDSDTGKKLKDLAVLKRYAASAERTAANVQQALERTAGDQARIRDNLSSVPRESALAERYMRMLEEQENRIAALNQERAKAEGERDRLNGEVRAFISRL